MREVNEKYGCPIACKYCVITKVECRKKLWDKKTLIGLNRAVTILNPPPDKNDKKALAEFYDFPLELLCGDIVGFNAISDPFWMKYENELKYFLENVSPLAKLVVCVTKFNVSDEMLKKLSRIPNFRLNVSITGLDAVEKTKTSDRLDLLRRAKKFKVKAFPIVHPYIAGMSDLSFLPELKKLGYDFIDFKGLRYNHENMKTWMPKNSQKFYRGTEEKEILPEDGWREKVESAGLKLQSLKKWYKKDCKNFQPKLKEKEARESVEKILPFANITSSATDAEVIRASILRRT